MKKSLYEISQEYIDLAEQLTDGEVTPELEKSLAITQQELQVKGVGYAMICKEMEAECEIIDNEIKRLQACKKTRQNAIDRLKGNLSGAMQMFGMLEIKTPIIKINFRKSESIEITDMESIPETYLRTIPARTEPDKTAIKEAIKLGAAIPGAELKVNQNIQIK